MFAEAFQNYHLGTPKKSGWRRHFGLQIVNILGKRLESVISLVPCRYSFAITLIAIFDIKYIPYRLASAPFINAYTVYINR